VTKIKILIAFAFLGFAYFLSSYYRNGNETAITSSNSIRDIPLASDVRPAVKPEIQLRTAGKKSATQQVPALSESVVNLAPAEEVLREEVKKDPHHTPPSVLSFAIELGQKMDNATESSEKATKLFNELSDCVNSEAFRSRPSIRAICLSNAGRLSRRVPALEDHFQELMRNTDRKIIDLVQ
jgi:hypothetical protein